MNNSEQHQVTDVILRDHGLDVSFEDGSRVFYCASLLHAARDLALVINSMDDPDGENLLPEIPDHFWDAVYGYDASTLVSSDNATEIVDWNQKAANDASRIRAAASHDLSHRPHR